MRRWPPIVWPLMSLASLLILMGLGPQDPVALAIGGVLALGVLAAAIWMTLGGRRGRPLPRWSGVLVGAAAGFYVANAVVAAFVDPRYVVASMLASVIPLTAVFLIVAGARSRPPGAGAGKEDPVPEIGPDEETPVGDTPEHAETGRAGEPEVRHVRVGR